MYMEIFPKLTSISNDQNFAAGQHGAHPALRRHRSRPREVLRHPRPGARHQNVRRLTHVKHILWASGLLMGHGSQFSEISPPAATELCDKCGLSLRLFKNTQMNQS